MLLNIKKAILKLKNYFNFLYYFKQSSIKNVYPCKLIGEKINAIGIEKIIIYKILGKGIFEILLKNLIENKTLIENFHPTDALKLGILAFEEIMTNYDKKIIKCKFNQIKKIMFNSIHDIQPNKGGQLSNNNYIKSNYNINEHNVFTTKNIYTCKLVGWKPKAENTTVIFTILGKKEGYEKILMELITNEELLAKFHPTEAIKFGFINAGDALLQPL